MRNLFGHPLAKGLLQPGMLVACGCGAMRWFFEHYVGRARPVGGGAIGHGAGRSRPGRGRYACNAGDAPVACGGGCRRRRRRASAQARARRHQTHLAFGHATERS